MTIDISLGELIVVMLFFLGLLSGIGKILIDQMQKSIKTNFDLMSDRFEAIENSNNEEKEQWKRVEKELNELQKDLPMRYVMREDHIRNQTILETKIDSLAGKLENVQLRQMLEVKKT